MVTLNSAKIAIHRQRFGVNPQTASVKKTELDKVPLEEDVLKNFVSASLLGYKRAAFQDRTKSQHKVFYWSLTIISASLGEPLARQQKS